MPCMFLTLDVSKLSGWLNADAPCPVESRAYGMGRGVGRKAGGCRATAAQAACTGRTRLKAEGQGTRGAHEKHGQHVRDTGRVEAQRLVERSRSLKSRKGGM